MYNKHYICVNSSGYIVDGWSDGPHPDKDIANAICLTEEGSYQFRLFQGGDENPALHTVDGIPLYKWEGEHAIYRTEAEIAADRLPSLDEAKVAKLQALSAACNSAIIAGCDVELTDGTTGHISLTLEDQINLLDAAAAINNGAISRPYHLDGQLTKDYLAEDIRILTQTAAAYKLYHTTYYNHLATYAKRLTTVEEVQAVVYGDALPDDLADSMTSLVQ